MVEIILDQWLLHAQPHARPGRGRPCLTMLITPLIAICTLGMAHSNDFSAQVKHVGWHNALQWINEHIKDAYINELCFGKSVNEWKWMDEQG